MRGSSPAEATGAQVCRGWPQRHGRAETDAQPPFNKACRLCAPLLETLLAHGEDLLGLALNDLAELGNQIPWISVQRHARWQREVWAVAAAGAAWWPHVRRGGLLRRQGVRLLLRQGVVGTGGGPSVHAHQSDAGQVDRCRHEAACEAITDCASSGNRL